MKRALLLTAISLATPSMARAHTIWVDPPARDAQDGYTVAPCGATSPSTGPTTDLHVGDTVTLTWRKTINHPLQTYTLSLSLDGVTNFTPFAMNIPGDTPATGTFTYSWTVPNSLCDPCALQVWQVDQTYVDYYSCANIRILPALPDAGTDGGADADGPTVASPNRGPGCACTVAAKTNATPWGALGLGALAALGLCRRRR